ncbi:hypothetical protein SteCoe_18613 [Stentor coeruleus]|uniref:Uncharacterized protein n=1 Tax=Stentor coeruleus TaxID=5963 RepID=A0A1R2BW53_9CILI|nr:hypothetical protein SteCoe_18613 [Stentor coeruleus]
MQSFQERFRTKSSTIGKSGELDINHNNAIQRPQDSQIHGPIQSPIIKTIAKTIIGPSSTPSQMLISNTPKYRNSSYNSQDFDSQLDSIETHFEDSFSNKKRGIDYKPYTIKDYNNIKPKKYYELGGLGSPTIGTEDWAKRKIINDKRIEYGKKAIKMPRENTITDCAIEYAEKIKYRFTMNTRHSTAIN